MGGGGGVRGRKADGGRGKKGETPDTSTSQVVCRPSVANLSTSDVISCHAISASQSDSSVARVAPCVSKFGNPLIRKILVLTSAYVRPYRLWRRARGVPKQPDRGRQNAIFSCI